jgi:hypothetical protein
MQNRSSKSFLSLAVLSLILGACSLPVHNLPNLEVHVTLPYGGALVSLGPITISAVAHSLDDVGDTGVTNFVFYASGRDIGHVSPPSVASSGIGATFVWTPPAAGEYLLQSEAQTSGGSAVSNTVRICVVDVAFSDVIDPHSLGYGFDGPCEVPAAGTGSGTIGMTARAIPDGGLAYNDDLRPNPADENNPIKIENACVPAVTSPTLNFEARLTDPGDQVAFVNVEITPTTGASSVWPTLGPLALAHTADSSTYEKIFTGGGLLFLDSDLAQAFLGNIGTLEWTARAFSRTGAVLVTDGPHSILAAPCVPVATSIMPIVVAPTETPTLVPVIEVTRRPRCGQYTTDSSCNAAPGCSYNYTTKKCTTK